MRAESARDSAALKLLQVSSARALAPK